MYFVREMCYTPKSFICLNGYKYYPFSFDNSTLLCFYPTTMTRWIRFCFIEATTVLKFPYLQIRCTCSMLSIFKSNTKSNGQMFSLCKLHRRLTKVVFHNSENIWTRHDVCFSRHGYGFCLVILLRDENRFFQPPCTNSIYHLQ